MKRWATRWLLAPVVLAANPAAAQRTIAENPLPGTAIISPLYFGQSFLVVPAGKWNNVNINIYRRPDNDPVTYAVGNLYLFSAPYTGTPNSLSSTTINRLGVGSAVDNRWTFSPTMTLQGGATYYFYSDTPIDYVLFNRSTRYDDGQAYTARNATSAYNGETFDLPFQVIAAAAAEPTTWAFMILGFGVVGSTLRRRQRFAATGHTSRVSA